MRRIARAHGIGFAIAAAIGIGAAVPARAAQVLPAPAMLTVTYNSAYYGSYVTLTSISKTYGTPAVSNGGAAGADNITITDGTTTLTNLEAYCVDVTNYLNGGVDTNFTRPGDGGVAYFSSLYAGANGQAIINRLDVLASNTLGQGQVTSATSSAALQLAIWDIVFSNPNPYIGTGYNGAPGGFSASTGSVIDPGTGLTVDQLAARFLTETSAPTTMALTTYENAGGTSQTLVTFTAVPLPAAAWLLLSALGGLAVFGRARRA
jgi:hypothetical protein